MILKHGNISGLGAEYSDYRTSGEIKVTYYYIKNETEFSISVIKPITILVGAYFGLNIGGGLNGEHPNDFPTMFIADENDTTVLTSIRNTETSSLTIKFEQNTTIDNINLTNNYILYFGDIALGYIDNKIFKSGVFQPTDYSSSNWYADTGFYCEVKQYKYYINESSNNNILGTYVINDLNTYPTKFINSNNNSYSIVIKDMTRKNL